MIVDNIKNIKQYNFNANLQEAFQFCMTCGDKEEGRYELSNGVYAMVQKYETKLLKDSAVEAHEKYIDLQFMVKGEEVMGYCQRGNGDGIGEYSSTDDFQLFENCNVNYMKYDEGDFALFFPSDLHAPRISVDEKPMNVVKVVVKIPLSVY